MPAIYEHRLEVDAEAIDQMGHANNAVYFVWLQHAAIAHSSANGWSVERYEELGAAWIARAHAIEYLQPAFLADKLVIKTWVSGVRKVVSWRAYQVFREADEQLLATAETKWAFVDLATARPKRVPSGFWSDFEIVERPIGSDWVDQHGDRRTKPA